LLKKTWGEQLISNFSYGLVFLALGIPIIILIVAGMMAGSRVSALVCWSLAAVYLIGLALVQSALQAIFQTALYLCARDGRVPAGFSPELLSNAITRSGRT